MLHRFSSATIGLDPYPLIRSLSLSIGFYWLYVCDDMHADTYADTYAPPDQLLIS